MSANLGLIGLGAAAIALGVHEASRKQLRPRTRSEWLRSFGTWGGPSYPTEDAKVERTVRMVRGALAADPWLEPYRLKVFGQGSSENNTNVRLISDVDLVVVAENSVWWQAAPGESFPNSHVGEASDWATQYRDLRTAVYRALSDRFRESGISDGNKAIKLASTASTRVECDVLPCFRLYRYLPRAQQKGLTPRSEGGVLFGTSNGSHVVSFPEQHLENGRAKNKATGYRYKQVVRILKSVRQNFASNMTILTHEDLPSSFQLECLVYNVPNNRLCEGDLYDAVRAALHWATWALEEPSQANRLITVSERGQPFSTWLTGLLLGHGEDGPDDVAACRRFLHRFRQLLDRRP